MGRDKVCCSSNTVESLSLLGIEGKLESQLVHRFQSRMKTSFMGLCLEAVRNQWGISLDEDIELLFVVLEVYTVISIQYWGTSKGIVIVSKKTGHTGSRCSKFWDFSDWSWSHGKKQFFVEKREREGSTVWVPKILLFMNRNGQRGKCERLCIYSIHEVNCAIG